MKICVTGVGYVGLVTAACLAEAGNSIICVDNDSGKIDSLKKGLIPIYEPGLEEMVKRNEKLGRLHFTTDLQYGLDNSVIIFIAVGTPSLPDGSPDMSAVIAVVRSIAKGISSYRIIATKSTVPVGTNQLITDTMKSITRTPFDYVSNPEFLKEGAAVEDFMSPDRIIIGANSQPVREVMQQLYGPFMRKSSRILFMDPASAEMAKYAANTMLATRISFMNELSLLCEKLGADIEMVRRGLGSDSRIGSAFLFPGVGYGGSCFPKDVSALIHTAQQQGIEMTIAKAVRQVNIKQQERFANQIIEYFAGKQGKHVLAVWGLAFKAKTDDVRQSPAIYCIEKFLEHGFEIRAYDPQAAESANKLLTGKIRTFESGYDVLDGADALVIFTDWQEFRNPDYKLIAEKLKSPVIFDGRNLYDPDIVKKAGFEYHSIGRATVYR
jgi:UDPglucose 6-dehydrogenase